MYNMMKKYLFFAFGLLLANPLWAQQKKATQPRPNIILIMADDLGYGDLSCYGATKISTPNVDKLASRGMRFTNGRATSATCTPSRFALMTGSYPWRRTGTEILPGDAALIVPTNKITLPSMLKDKGYYTGIVGKWHLGLGTQVEKNWNTTVSPGPNQTGFDYSFIFPATADRVPTVFLENQTVIAADANDPIHVDYEKPIGNDPTGKDHPELLKMKASPNHGHNQTIVNGIGRIGYMTGGTRARWVDEEISTTFLAKAKGFIEQHKAKPFFLCMTLTEPHVPRMPATAFRGKSQLGYRGDAILQLDWTIGEIMKQLEYMGIAKNTLVIFSSDNGPVLDDGYVDEAVTKQNGHIPTGPFRGGKYSAFDGGTRVPFIVSWPGAIKPGISDAMISQVDLLASLASLVGRPLTGNEAPDSFNLLGTLMGKTKAGRNSMITEGGALSYIKGNWKYIEPHKGPALLKLTNIESGNSPQPQLYDLSKDKGEQNNLADQHPELVKELAALLEKEKAAGRTRL